MRDSTKTVWFARILAILFISFGFSYLISSTSENTKIFKKKIEIKVNENTEEIVNAIEKIGGNNISIKVKDETTWYYKKPIVLWGGIGLCIYISFCLAIYYGIYCAIFALLTRQRKDKSIATIKKKWYEW